MSTRTRIDVALVASSFLPRFGGVEEHVLNTAKALRDSGLTVVIWAVDQGDAGVPDHVDGIPVRYLPCPLPNRSASGLVSAARRIPPALARWWAAVRQDRPAVIHVHCFGPNGVYAAIVARAARLRLIVSAHGETFMDADGIFDASALMRRALRRALTRADQVTACSAFAAQDLVDRFGLRPGRARVVFNGVASSEPGGPVPSWLPARYILVVARLVRTKGIDLLLEAVAGVGPGVSVVVGGDGPEADELARQASRLGIADRVVFAGRLDRATVVTVMRNAEVLVVPSRIEAFGITILEGWRAGVPVIATEIGGPPEFVRDRVNGLLVDPHDVGRLGALVAEVLQEPEMAGALAAAGHVDVGAFTWDAVAEAYREIYRT